MEQGQEEGQGPEVTLEFAQPPNEGPITQPRNGADQSLKMGEHMGSNPDSLEDHDDLAARLSQLAAERDEALIARQRALADFANFQRRAGESEIRAFQNGAARIIRDLLGPLDNLDLALDAGARSGTIEQLLQGVRIVRGEIAKALAEHGVSTILPERGEEFDPMRHEAMLKQPAPDLEPNTIAQTLQPGYAMGELVLRPAKVAVAGER